MRRIDQFPAMGEAITSAATKVAVYFNSIRLAGRPGYSGSRYVNGTRQSTSMNS